MSGQSLPITQSRRLLSPQPPPLSIPSINSIPTRQDSLPLSLNLLRLISAKFANAFSHASDSCPVSRSLKGVHAPENYSVIGRVQYILLRSLCASIGSINFFIKSNERSFSSACLDPGALGSQRKSRIRSPRRTCLPRPRTRIIILSLITL
jgi:hypothetical protein